MYMYICIHNVAPQQYPHSIIQLATALYYAHTHTYAYVHARLLQIAGESPGAW